MKAGLDLAAKVIDAADEIMAEIDNDDAYEFAESVKGKAQGIQDTIERMGRSTENQCAALENMLTGCERWLERRR